MREALSQIWQAERRRAVLFVPVLVGVGVQLYFLLPFEPPLAWGATGLALPAIAFVLARGRGGPVLAAAVIVASISAGLGAGVVRAWVVAAPVVAATGSATIEGRVREITQSASGRPRLELDRVHIYGLPVGQTPARVRVSLLKPTDAEGVGPGTNVSVFARLGPPGEAVEPGAFDFRRAAWFEGIGAIATARGRVAVLEPTPPDGASERAAICLAVIRQRLGAGLRAGIGGEAGAFAAAIVTGDRAAIPVAAVQALRDSNLAHLLAISGLHMAMVAGLAFVFVRLALVLIPGAGLRLPAKKIAAVAALLVAIAYLGISGAAIATQRAAIMAAIVFGAILADRPAVTLRALAAAATVILLLTPESLTQVGFQMSFAATVALVAVYDAARGLRWLPPTGRTGARALRYGAALVLTSLIAGLATAPFAAFHFNRATSYGLLANLAAVPAMGLWVAPSLALAGLAAPFGLADPFLRVAGWGIDWILIVARHVSEMDGATRAVAAVPPLALGLIAAGGLWLALWRTRVRLAGLAALLAGAAVWVAGAQRPAILIAPGAQLVGVLGPQGRAVDHPTAGAYAAETWLRRDGDRATQREAAARPGFMREGPWRRAEVAGVVALHIFRGARVDAGAIARRCRDGAVILLPRLDFPPRPGCVLLDRERLAALGAISIGAEGLRAARPEAATRPWAR